MKYTRQELENLMADDADIEKLSDVFGWLVAIGIALFIAWITIVTVAAMGG